MSITLPTELEELAREKAQAAGLTVEAYVEMLIREDEWLEGPGEAIPDTDREFEQVRSAVSEGLSEAEREEGDAASDVFARLREKHALPR